jgi:hypothetical protein
MVDINPMKDICLGESLILDGVAELFDDLFGWDFFFVEGSFELRVHFIIFIAEFVYLLKGIEAFYCRDEFLSGDLIVSVEVYETDPLSDLERGLVWHEFFQTLFEFELTDARFAVHLAFLKDNDWVDLSIPQDNAEFLDSLFKLLVLDLFFILLLHILH